MRLAQSLGKLVQGAADVSRDDIVCSLLPVVDDELSK
jgi:hypothetical protein